MLKRLITVCLIAISGATFGQSAAQRYIELYKQDAVKKMNEYGVPASIILGVAMHESGSGTSKIAKYLNNHFGVKGRNDSKDIRSAYKGYDSVSQSYDDFIGILKSHVQFSRLFEKYNDYDYKSWARGIQRGGYAHSSTWASQVMAIIKKYNLWQYDNRPDSSELAYLKPAQNLVSENEIPETYRVKSGDTLNIIAKRFGTTAQAIKNKNGLRSNILQIGQRLSL
ncbi:LysM peptidoglycan-binding domain-containing protein [Pedobacter sp. HMF7647]|uniref:Peptidoglycan hydrolase n=1 Tax=Hufsiella arboris TaxID=2695275 RepID=A0A7K1Y5I8_9SPHI|nr:glucosaminidase domain-containing protein [Hufsiella arboris]MXV49855.1 LysM peptidoglycan-binding domain-containing protein [Hufsiella arboris]